MHAQVPVQYQKPACLTFQSSLACSVMKASQRCAIVTQQCGVRQVPVAEALCQLSSTGTRLSFQVLGSVR